MHFLLSRPVNPTNAFLFSTRVTGQLDGGRGNNWVLARSNLNHDAERLRGSINGRLDQDSYCHDRGPREFRPRIQQAPSQKQNPPKRHRARTQKKASKQTNIQMCRGRPTTFRLHWTWSWTLGLLVHDGHCFGLVWMVIPPSGRTAC